MVGTIVLYHPGAGKTPLAAIVVGIVDDETLNLTVFPGSAPSFETETVTDVTWQKQADGVSVSGGWLLPWVGSVPSAPRDGGHFWTFVPGSWDEGRVKNG